MTKTSTTQHNTAQHLPIVLLTSCTATQSVEPPEELTGASLPTELTTMEAVDEWAARLAKHPPSITPAQLYRGISFYSVTKAQSFIAPDNIKIISIGQGLVGLREKITPYDLSISPDHKNSLTRVVTAEPFLPAFWWQLLNGRLRDDETPCTTQLLRDDIKLLIVSCSGRFLELITEDLLNGIQLNPEHGARLRVITSGMGNIPNHLKPFALKYDRRLNITAAGNRNDLLQRAALHFMRMLHNDPELLEADITAHNTAVQEALDRIQSSSASTGANAGSSPASKASLGLHLAREYLQRHPELQELGGEAAYKRFVEETRSHVSASQFRRAWRTIFTSHLTPTPRRKGGGGAAKVATATMDAALQALQSIEKALERSSAKVTSWQDEDDALDLLEVFVAALRQSHPDAKFSSAEVHAWARQYSSAAGVPLPTPLKNIHKLAHLLKEHHATLGLETITVNPGQGGVMYKLAQLQEPETTDE